MYIELVRLLSCAACQLPEQAEKSHKLRKICGFADVCTHNQKENGFQHYIL